MAVVAAVAAVVAVVAVVVMPELCLLSTRLAFAIQIQCKQEKLKLNHFCSETVSQHWFRFFSLFFGKVTLKFHVTKRVFSNVGIKFCNMSIKRSLLFF